MNGSRVASVRDRCDTVVGVDERNLNFFFNPSFFTWEPPGINDKSEFDDLLLWMTREELSLAIPGDIPRLPQMIMPY